MQTVSDFQYKIQQSRSKIAHEYASLGDALNLPKRLQHSVQQKPWPWISGLFFMGIGLPWFLKKSTHTSPQELTSSTALSLEKEKKSSGFSKCALVAASLLQDKTIRSGLFSTARFLFPLVQEAVIDYRSRKQDEKQNTSAENFQ